jgi:hypothetical protein
VSEDRDSLRTHLAESENQMKVRLKSGLFTLTAYYQYSCPAMPHAPSRADPRHQQKGPVARWLRTPFACVPRVRGTYAVAVGRFPALFACVPQKMQMWKEEVPMPAQAARSAVPKLAIANATASPSGQTPLASSPPALLTRSPRTG